VRERLKDPDSAHFGRSTVNAAGIVCGSVNAKNSFGGYSGTSAFGFDRAVASCIS